MTYEAHPYALMLPPLTDEEYAALKADITEHGILYPLILDEDGLILDGVHRAKIATELGIEPPVSTHTGLDDERKLHLAVGLNMRRRHLDSDRRRDLVHKLNKEQGLSVRKIASITGWSKSTVDRDLKTSPFEEMIKGSAETAAAMRELADRMPDEARNFMQSVADAVGWFGQAFGFGDEQWKRGNWPPAPEDHLLLTLEMYTINRTLDQVFAAVAGKEIPPDPIDWRPIWDTWTPEERRKCAEWARERKFLFQPRVPNGTAVVTKDEQ
jgi:hypothetical protein